MSEREMAGESEFDRAERRLLAACDGVDRQLEAAMREVRRANKVLQEARAEVASESKPEQTGESEVRR